MRTTTLYTLRGVSKAKTAKAVLLFDEVYNREAWIPTSVGSVKFVGPNYKVEVTVPGWFFSKIAWKTL